MRVLLSTLFLGCVVGCISDDPEERDVTNAAEEDAADGPFADQAAKEEAFAVSQASTRWDGVAPASSSCWNDRRSVQSTHLLRGGHGRAVTSIIYLYYSPSCRTTWAHLTGGTIASRGDNAGGSAQIIRNSDGRTYTCNVTTSSGECTTRMVNDVGVTSYAFGSEDSGFVIAWARTANY